MEHFEFARLLFQSIPALAVYLGGGEIDDHPDLAAALKDFFVKKMDDFELGRKEDSLFCYDRRDHLQYSSAEAHDIDSNAGILYGQFQSLLDQSDEITRTMPYANNQSRGQGTPGSRRTAAASVTDPDMLTPQSVTTAGTPRPIADRPEIYERRAKRRKLAAKPETRFIADGPNERNLAPRNTASSLGNDQPTFPVDADPNPSLEQGLLEPSANGEDGDFSYLFYGMSSGFQERGFDLIDTWRDETANLADVPVSTPEEAVLEGSSQR